MFKWLFKKKQEVVESPVEDIYDIAFQRGKDDYLRNKTEKDNPYEKPENPFVEGIYEHYKWNRGFEYERTKEVTFVINYISDNISSWDINTKSTAYKKGYKTYTFDYTVLNNPYKKEESKNNWYAGWLKAHDDYEEWSEKDSQHSDWLDRYNIKEWLHLGPFLEGLWDWEATVGEAISNHPLFTEGEKSVCFSLLHNIISYDSKKLKKLKEKLEQGPVEPE